MICWRSSGVIVPIRERGGITFARSTMLGTPPGSRVETSASPTPSCVITSCGLEGRVGPEGLGRRLDPLLLGRREGAQRVLHPVAELAQDHRRHVGRVLGDEIDADALGADQPHHLLDLLGQRLGRVVEQQVRLVEEEDELGLVQVADLGQLLEQLRQQPEQEGGVEPRRVDQLVGHQHVDRTAPVRRRAASGRTAPAPARRRNARPPAARASAGGAGWCRSWPC